MREVTKLVEGLVLRQILPELLTLKIHNLTPRLCAKARW